MDEAQKSNNELTDADAEYAFNMLTELTGNLEAGILVLDEAIVGAQGDALSAMMFVNIMRMTLSWLILSLAKVEELWRKYGRFATGETKVKMRSIVREIASKGILPLRNKAIAHLLDKDTGNPMPPEQLQADILGMMNGDMLGFFHWLRHPSDAQTETVVGTLMTFRSEIHDRFPYVRNYMEVVLAPGQTLSSLLTTGANTLANQY